MLYFKYFPFDTHNSPVMYVLLSHLHLRTLKYRETRILPKGTHLQRSRTRVLIHLCSMANFYHFCLNFGDDPATNLGLQPKFLEESVEDARLSASQDGPVCCVLGKLGKA